MGNVLFFLLVVVAIIVVLVIQSSNNIEIANQKRDSIKKELDGFNVDSEYWYDDILFLVDSSKEMVAISDNCLKNKMIPFSEIIGCEIMENSKVTGGVGRAVVGGVLAGGAGAIVGASTARNESVVSYDVVIYRENIDDPKIVLKILKAKTKTSSYIYDNAVKFATDINATVKAIISRNNKNKDSNSAAPTGFKDKLIQLEDLKKSGLISLDEYEQKRNKVLESI